MFSFPDLLLVFKMSYACSNHCYFIFVGSINNIFVFVSTFGATIAFSKTVDKEIAKHASSVFLDAVIAPDFDPDALEILKKNEALRIIKLITPYKTIRTMQEQEVHITPFGTLVQETDNKELDKDTFKVVSKTKPDAEMIEDMVFAWKIAKHVKTNAFK